MPREMRPRWDTCSVINCTKHTISMDVCYCADHVPISGFVRNDQLAQARQYLKRGATLNQAAVRLKLDPRDLDLALWNRLGQPLREAQW